LTISGGKGKAAIANHLHDHVHDVPIRQQSQQLAGEAAVPYGVVGQSNQQLDDNFDCGNTIAHANV